MNFDINDVNFLHFVLYPFMLFIGLMILSITYYIKSINNRSNNFDEPTFAKPNIGKILTYFVLFGSLIFTGIIYSIIVYTKLKLLNLEELALVLSGNEKIYFISAIILSMIIKTFIFNIFLKIASKNDIVKTQKAMTFSILGIVIGGAPEIFGLIFMFQKLSSF